MYQLLLLSSQLLKLQRLLQWCKLVALSGKYDFVGIKKTGAALVRGALAADPKLAWLLKLGTLLDLLIEFVLNWMANRGLLVFNVGFEVIDGVVDQKQLDAQLRLAYEEIRVKGGREKLTKAQKKAIDDQVIKAARKFVVINQRR